MRVTLVLVITLFAVPITPCRAVTAAIKEKPMTVSPGTDTSSNAARAAALRDSCWKWYVESDPLDAFTIGVRDAGARLPDISHEGWARQDEHAREVLAEIALLRVEALPMDLALAIEAIRRDALYTRHHFSRRFHLWNTEWSVVPPKLFMLQAGASRNEADWTALAERLEAYPRLLADHETNLRQGAIEGVHADYDETQLVVERLLPTDAIPILSIVIPKIVEQAGAPTEPRARVGKACQRAAEVLERHRQFLSQYMGGLPREWKPDGVAEVTWRLRELQGLDTTPQALFDSASTWVDSAREELITQAKGIDSSVQSIADARALLARTAGKHPADAAEALGLYRRAEDRMEAAARAAGLPLPPNYRVRVEAAPLGFGRVASVSNIPASLLVPDEDPLFVVSVEDEFLAQHDPTDAAVMAAHEGTPGHALMSGWWHHLLQGVSRPISWVHQHDLTNELSGSWQTMMCIEGWALTAEGLLARHYSPEEGLSAQAAQLLRAVRVRIDVGLHAGYLDREQAAQELAQGVGMEIAVARSAIRNRYGRKAWVGQALTYLVGKREIESLRKEWRSAHPGSSDNEFYAAYLRFPPLPPRTVRRWMLPS